MIVGTAGHVDHGKTTLVEALTGIDCDKLAAERQRGMTIELGFAPWQLPDGRQVSIIDVPGHARLVHTMATGASGMQAVLLVVAADEGLMPQTWEHLSVCRLLGITQGVVAVTCVDRVTDLQTRLSAIKQALHATPLADAPVLPVCAPRRKGLTALGEAFAKVLCTTAGEEKPPPAALPLWLSIDRAFSVRGFGTVVTGSLLRGRLQQGQMVCLAPSGKQVRVRGLHVHNRAVPSIQATCRVAVNVPDLHLDDVQRGSVLCNPTDVIVAERFDAWVEWLPHLSKPLRQTRSLGFICGAKRAQANVRADGVIRPGESGTARIVLDRPVALAGDLRFVLRGSSHPTLGAIVGGGRILDADPPRRRKSAVRRALLADGRIETLLREAGQSGVEASIIAARLGCAPLSEDGRKFHADAVAQAAQEIVSRVTQRHKRQPGSPGLPTAELDLGPIQEAAVQQAASQGLVVFASGLLLLPDHAAHCAAEATVLARRVLVLLEAQAAAAPSEEALAHTFDVPLSELRTALRQLVNEHKAVRKSGLVFAMSVLERLRSEVCLAVSGGTALPVSWLKDRAGVTRRHAIPIWEWLDGEGATQRKGNVRIAGPCAYKYI